jgi:hypothetical protein
MLTIQLYLVLFLVVSAFLAGIWHLAVRPWWDKSTRWAWPTWIGVVLVGAWLTFTIGLVRITSG